MLQTIPETCVLTTSSLHRRKIKSLKPPQHFDRLLLQALLLAVSTALTGYVLRFVQADGMSKTKSPLLFHHFMAPEILLVAALYNPIPRDFNAQIFLPPLMGIYWTLLGTSTVAAPCWGFGIGMYVAFHSLNALQLLLFQPPPPGRPATFWDAVAMTYDFRGIGEPWQTQPIPLTNYDNWWFGRVKRLVICYVWFDFLVWWYRVYDRAYHVPLPYGAHDTLPSQYRFPGIKNPEFPYTISSDPLPAGWTVPENPLVRHAFLAALRALREILHMTTIFAGFIAVHTIFSILIVGVGELCGYRRGWCNRYNWPNVFGHPFRGDFGHGVRGFWSKAWHGMFRRIFVAPSLYLFPKSSPDSIGKALTWLLVPFLVSGLLHLLSVWTVSSNCGWGTVRFFALQPIGMMAEIPLLRAARWRQNERRPYWWLWRTAVYLWAVAFLVTTCRGFFEEYRWYGLWWTEPVPVSLRMWLVEGKTLREAWRWGGTWMRWVKDVDEGGVMGRWGVVLVP